MTDLTETTDPRLRVTDLTEMTGLRRASASRVADPVREARAADLSRAVRAADPVRVEEEALQRLLPLRRPRMITEEDVTAIKTVTASRRRTARSMKIIWARAGITAQVLSRSL